MTDNKPPYDPSRVKSTVVDRVESELNGNESRETLIDMVAEEIQNETHVITNEHHRLNASIELQEMKMEMVNENDESVEMVFRALQSAHASFPTSYEEGHSQETGKQTTRSLLTPWNTLISQIRSIGPSNNTTPTNDPQRSN